MKKTALFEQWFDQYADYLFRYASFAVQGNESLAYDLVQECFSAVWLAMDDFSEKSHIRTWLVGILKNKIADYYRKQQREQGTCLECEMEKHLEDFDANGSWNHSVERWHNEPEQLCTDQDFYQALLLCMQQLPTINYQVLFRGSVQGELVKNLCKDLELSATNYYVLMHRARLLMHQCLDKNWFNNEAKNV